MKKTYRKVILRTLKGTFSRFAAIAAIVALGVGLLSGLMAMPIDMRDTIDRYFDRQHMHDLRIVSPLGLTDDDVRAIRDTEGVDEVMPAYMADVFMDAGETKNIVTRVHSLPSAQIEEREPENYLNRIDIIEGRLPVRRGECVVVKSRPGAPDDTYAIGTTLHAAETNGDLSDTLADTDFKIVGIAQTSCYFSVARENASIGDGTVALKIYVGEESFSQKAYSEIFVSVDGARDLSSETQGYRTLVGETAQRIEALAPERCTARFNEVKAEIEQQLADGRKELADARRDADEQFADAEAQLADGRKELEQAEAALADAKRQIATGEKELAAGKQSLPGTLQEQSAKLAEGKAALVEGKQKLAENEALLAAKRQELADAKAKLEAAKQLIPALEPPLAEAEQQTAALGAKLPGLRAARDRAQADYDAAADAADLPGKQAAFDTAAQREAAAAAALQSAQQAVADGMAADGCATEQEWLAQQPETAGAALAARDSSQLAHTQAAAEKQTAETELAAARAAAAPAQAALSAAENQLALAEGAYNTAAASLASLRRQVDDAKRMIAEGEPQIIEGEKQLAEGEKQLAAARNQLLEAEKAIVRGESALNLAPTLAQLKTDLAEQQLAGAREKAADGEAELRSGQEEYEKNEAEYLAQKADAERQMADAEQQLADGEKQLAELEVPEWFVLDRTDHVSASNFLSDVDKLEAITTVFPIFFFLVAALVALTTMTRMVDEERLQIGTLKALGYHRGQIMFKYLFYAWAATLAGGVLGLAFGFTVLPAVIWNAYGTMYSIPDFRCMFHTDIAVLGVGAALLCTGLATWNACSRTLREWAAQLLLPKAPAAGKRILLERITPVWKRMKFTHKVTARNLFRYKKRFFMTVIGVAGCTSLLVTGFGLKDSIGDIVSKQFSDIFTYDFMLTLSDDRALENDAFRAVMDDPGQVKKYLPAHQERVSLDVGGESYDLYLFVPQTEQALPDFVDLHERKTRTPTPLVPDGVVITEKFSNDTGLTAGDVLPVSNGRHHRSELPITGVAENYVETYVYMTPGTYERAFGDVPEPNSVLCILPEAGADVPEALSAALLDVDGVAGLTGMNAMRSSLDDTIASINYVVYVIILCAGLLAFVVLYNLMNINVTERAKEIATIKVLGFYEKEVQAYVYRESNILSLIGMIAGLFGGVLLHKFIMTTVEVDMVMFGQQIKPLSFLFSAVLTLVFAQFVNLVMRRKLRGISMVESMKAPE